jgi:proteasome lid subunit RPN8/RPN11
MDPEISFGDVQHAERQTYRRPDQNKHYAVAPVFAPEEGELRIYVDIDAMRDMETHALSNTNVELGGVLLGGQYEDEDGRPFVVVTDSLRAAHYESTKGSFKFTHDTWSQITKERDEFPEELQMVGWYHTHPDWGVFLSGMDMFICDNFFNKPLDVALVIDPCRDDRGFFQWTGDPSQRKRRTGGFYLIGSRFRADELEFYAAQLEGEATMASDLRRGGYAGAYPAPVVNIADRGGAWQAPAVLGMLTLQFCLLALLAWRLLAPATDADALAARDKKLDAIEKRMDELVAIESAQAELGAQRQLLDRIVGQVDIAPQGLVSALEDERRRIEQLEAAVSGQAALAREKTAQFERERILRRQDKNDLDGRIATLESERDKLKQSNKKLSENLDDLETRLAKYEPEEPEKKEAEDGEGEETDWTWYIAGAVAAVLLVGGALAWMFASRGEEEIFTEDEPPPTNNPEEDPPR